MTCYCVERLVLQSEVLLQFMNDDVNNDVWTNERSAFDDIITFEGTNEGIIYEYEWRRDDEVRNNNNISFKNFFFLPRGGNG